MGLKAGALLWNRQRLTLENGFTTVDTGLTQVNQAFGNMSPNEPPLGVTSAPPGPADGTLPASRVHVIPQSPRNSWATISHGEPFVDPVTRTVKVTFSNTLEGPVTINVLFWDPHSMVGPGEADTYNAAP